MPLSPAGSNRSGRVSWIAYGLMVMSLSLCSFSGLAALITLGEVVDAYRRAAEGPNPVAEYSWFEPVRKFGRVESWIEYCPMYEFAWRDSTRLITAEHICLRDRPDSGSDPQRWGWPQTTEVWVNAKRPSRSVLEADLHVARTMLSGVTIFAAITGAVGGGAAMVWRNSRR